MVCGVIRSGNTGPYRRFWLLCAMTTAEMETAQHAHDSVEDGDLSQRFGAGRTGTRYLGKKCRDHVLELSYLIQRVSTHALDADSDATPGMVLCCGIMHQALVSRSPNLLRDVCA